MAEEFPLKSKTGEFFGITGKSCQFSWRRRPPLTSRRVTVSDIAQRRRHYAAVDTPILLACAERGTRPMAMLLPSPALC